MPTISSFYGILIRMYYNDHEPPHFHALYGELQATVSIDELRVLEVELSAACAGCSTGPSCIRTNCGKTGGRRAREERAQEGCAVEIIERSDMYWDIVEVMAEKNHSLWLRFADGVTGVVRMDSKEFTGALEPLRDLEFFEKVFVEHGAASWPGEIELARDAV